MTTNCYFKLSSKSTYKSNRIYFDLFSKDYPQLCARFRDLCLERKSKSRLKHAKLIDYQKRQYLKFKGDFEQDEIVNDIIVNEQSMINNEQQNYYYLYCKKLPEFFISLGQQQLPARVQKEYKVFGRVVGSSVREINELIYYIKRKKHWEIEIYSTGIEEEGELKNSRQKKSRSRERQKLKQKEHSNKHHSHRHHHHRRNSSRKKSVESQKQESKIKEENEEVEKEEEEKLLKFVEKGVMEEEQNEEEIIQQRKLQRMMLVAKLSQQNMGGEQKEKEKENNNINNNNVTNQKMNEFEDEDQFEEVGLEQRKSLKVDQAQLDYFKLVDQLRQKQFDEQLEADTKEQENKQEVTEQLKEEAAKQPKKEVFDMFADSPINLDEKNDTLKPVIPILSQLEWDDEDHYLKVQIGEILNGQYQVTQKCGKGVFSNVIQAVDRVTQLPCALKAKKLNQQIIDCFQILRSDEIFIRAGERERDILKQLNITDKSDKRHIIRMYGSFEYRKHLILVFELMERDLRETLKIYGKKIGLSLEAVRSYAKQMFVALSHMKKQRIIHADIKPDNILTDQKSNKVKLCDFGTAFSTSETILVEELQSRFYRAPEIILGCPYDTAIDMWSMGVALYELYTGNFLFPGSTNNHMLKLMMQTKGKPNNRMIRRGEFSGKYFDPNYQFLSNEIDKVTQEQYIKPIKVSEKPQTEFDLSILLKLNDPLLNGEQLKELMMFRDLLEKTLMMDPNKRISPEDALRHPFISPPSILTQKK